MRSSLSLSSLSQSRRLRRLRPSSSSKSSSSSSSCRRRPGTANTMTAVLCSVVMVVLTLQQRGSQQVIAFTTPSVRQKSSSPGSFHGSACMFSPKTKITPTTATAPSSTTLFFDQSQCSRKFLVERRVHQPAKLSPSSDNNNNNDNNNDNINASQDVDIAITAAATDLSGAGAVIQTTPQPGKGLVPPFTVTLEGDDYSYKDAIARTLGWVGAATIFGGALWAFGGSEMGEEFFAGYIVEQSLSVDNLFVFLLLFEYFKIPLPSQDRVLNWGIYGAIVMRAIMIGLGAAALKNFHQILLVFAAILVYGSAKFFIGQWSGKDGDEDEEDDPSQNSIVRLARSIYPSTDTFDGNRFFTMIDGIRTATPLFICCVAVEISDVVFAVDSIPAVFGVTEDPLIVFSSNIFAIMGLRSLYTILSKAATDLKYLEPAVALVLGFIGSKMIAEYLGYIIPTSIALGVVATLLSTGVGLSVLERSNETNINNANTVVPLVEDSVEP